jgi:hypothetical protein
VMVVVVIAVGTVYTFKHSPLTYQESATMVLTPPRSVVNPNPYNSFGDSLITTGGLVAVFMMGPQGQQKVRATGAAGDYSVALVNLYNQQYPNYSEPYVTVSATAQDPATTHSTFVAVTRLFNNDLAARQAGVPLIDRITAQEVGDTGPLIQSGSQKRTLAGLAVLTIIVGFFLLTFLDRHPVRLRGLVRIPAARRDP